MRRARGQGRCRVADGRAGPAAGKHALPFGATKNDPALAAGLGKLAEYFVMDAFGTAHRAHSSTAGVAKHVKLAAAGFLA